MINGRGKSKRIAGKYKITQVSFPSVMEGGEPAMSK